MVVRTVPGATALTRTPWPASSLDSDQQGKTHRLVEGDVIGGVRGADQGFRQPGSDVGLAADPG